MQVEAEQGRLKSRSVSIVVQCSIDNGYVNKSARQHRFRSAVRSDVLNAGGRGIVVRNIQRTASVCISRCSGGNCYRLRSINIRIINCGNVDVAGSGFASRNSYRRIDCCLAGVAAGQTDR